MAIILPAVFNPFGIFLIRQQMRQVPSECVEAARMDGAGELRIFISVYLSMVRSGIMALLMHLVIEYWNLVDQVILFIRQPDRTGEYVNGRYLYAIPAEAVQEDKDNNKLYIYTARSYRDILGERSLVTTIIIYVKEELDGDQVVVDGIVREEPVITENFDVLYEGQAVLEKDMK